MMRPWTAWSSTLAVTLTLGWAAAVWADEKSSPDGTWEWTITTQGGQTFTNTLKLKHDGDKLSGTVTGRGGRETAIEDGKYKDGEVSFQVTRERNGNKFTVKYRGKVSDDTIKGKMEFERNGQAQSRDWEAKRIKKEG